MKKMGKKTRNLKNMLTTGKEERKMKNEKNKREQAGKHAENKNYNF